MFENLCCCKTGDMTGYQVPVRIICHKNFKPPIHVCNFDEIFRKFPALLLKMLVQACIWVNVKKA